MSEPKTKPTDASVKAFLATVDDEQKRKDCYALLELFQDVTGEPAVMWGSAIIGFGTYRYKGKSGQEGDWMITGFSPRKANLTLYIMNGYGEYQDLLAKLGKATTSKSCLYVKKLEDIDMAVLRELIKQSVAYIRAGKLSSVE